jgi:hypothetical protein
LKWSRVYLALAVLVLLPMMAFAKNEPGQSVVLKGKSSPEWPVTIVPYGGKLLLSDSPETVPADGILYRDTVSGNIRIFMYHVNGTKRPQKILAVLTNPGKKTVHIAVYKQGYSGPGYNYMQVGKEAQFRYLENHDYRSITIEPGKMKLLDESQENITVHYNELINGIYDLIADRPVTVSIIMLPQKENYRKFMAKASVLPTDASRLRGTFEGKDRLVIPDRVYDGQQDGPVVITLADNHIDPYAKGVDGTDGSPALNYGNYGVFYHLFLPGDKGETAYFLNPRGGAYAGVMGIVYRHRPSVLATPKDKLYFGVSETDAAYLGKFDSAQSLWLTFSPPGASNLPVKLVIEPRPE